MRNFRTTLLCLLGLTFGLSVFAQNGELLLFYQPDQDAVTQDFQENYIPKIRAMAEAQNIVVQEVTIQDAAPEMITATPAIVFQNHLGRSLYIGRYHYVDKIKTFIRTVKRMPQKDVINEKHEAVVWENGRSTIVTPVKITDLSGDLPGNFNAKKFHQKALKAVADGMENYRLEGDYDAHREDRLMYVALYPYRNEDGQLFISTEVYSQFNCVDPVFKQFEEPVFGEWKDYERVFGQAGAMLEKEIQRQLQSPERGDGLKALGEDIAVMGFEEMGYPLPDKPAGAGPDFSAVDLEVPRIWTPDGPADPEVPEVSFAFLPPLDYYAGEVSNMRGSLTLGPDKGIESMKARFEVDLENLTMGDEYLDHSVEGMIEMADYPKATFFFDKAAVIDQPVVTWGTTSQFTVQGTMDFKGVQAPLKVTGRIDPILTEDGEPRLQVFASFRLPLTENYGVEGPDGTAEASSNLDFNLNFLMKPVE